VRPGGLGSPHWVIDRVSDRPMLACPDQNLVGGMFAMPEYVVIEYLPGTKGRV